MPGVTDSDMLNGGFRLGDLTVIVMLLVNLVAAVWFAAQLSARVGVVESQLLTVTTRVEQLNTAREATDLHLAKVDDTYTELNGKITSVLDILKSWQDTADPQQGSPSRPPANFPKRK